MRRCRSFASRPLGGHERGYTLAELVLVCTLLVILAGVALTSGGKLPRGTVKRSKEADLRLSLRVMRDDNDEFEEGKSTSTIRVNFVRSAFHHSRYSTPFSPTPWLSEYTS